MISSGGKSVPPSPCQVGPCQALLPGDGWEKGKGVLQFLLVLCLSPVCCFLISLGPHCPPDTSCHPAHSEVRGSGPSTTHVASGAEFKPFSSPVLPQPQGCRPPTAILGSLFTFSVLDTWFAVPYMKFSLKTTGVVLPSDSIVGGVSVLAGRLTPQILLEKPPDDLASALS